MKVDFLVINKEKKSLMIFEKHIKNKSKQDIKTGNW